MSTNPDDELEAWLRTEEPYVKNAEFAQHVVAQLPQRRNLRLRRRVIKAGMLLGGIAACAGVISTNAHLAAIVTGLWQSAAFLTLGTIGAALLIAAACAWIAFDRA